MHPTFIGLLIIAEHFVICSTLAPSIFTWLYSMPCWTYLQLWYSIIVNG